jgi:predicted MFS family arabinose efflux permease
MAGPVIGSLIYGFVGYEYTFYCFSGIIGLGLIASLILLPTRLNKISTEVAQEEQRKSVAIEE